MRTRRGRAATIFKELLQRRKQGKLCTILSDQTTTVRDTQQKLTAPVAPAATGTLDLTQKETATWTGTAGLGLGSQPTLREGPTEPHR